ncbi:MAG TPA: hypothetical protein VFZ66_04445 [Herpetosiphonaceae bacterium]
MLASVPVPVPARITYIQELEAALAQLDHAAALARMPWALLALNATFYLDRYLTAAAYRVALRAAIDAAGAERQGWPTPSGDAPADLDELQPPVEAGATRQTLYRWVFDRAVSSGNPAQFLLAQHACEIAEVVPESFLSSALRMGLLPVPVSSFAAPPTASATPGARSIEQLSRALLRHRLTPRDFAESLLVLHAAQRAQELTGHAYAVPLAPPDHAQDSDLSAACTPKRLRIGQPHDLAARALASANPLAIMTVEAGLVEAETLHGAPQLLLLAALDRALSGLL